MGLDGKTPGAKCLSLCVYSGVEICMHTKQETCIHSLSDL